MANASHLCVWESLSVEGHEGQARGQPAGWGSSMEPLREDQSSHV